jgi:hypothetical protein
VLKDWTEHTEVRGVADGERRIFEHIARHRVQAHGSETWLAEGLRHHTADECPFCGQRLAGEVQKVIDELRTAFERTQDERVRREFDYFDRNKDAVAYGAYREKGWSTAGSEVESSHRHVVQVRLKIPGAWWHSDNVPNIPALRMLKANRWWDEYATATRALAAACPRCRRQAQPR